MSTTALARTALHQPRICTGCTRAEPATSFAPIPARVEFVVDGKLLAIDFPVGFTSGTHCVECNAVYDRGGAIDRLRTKMLRDAREAARRRKQYITPTAVEFAA